MTEYRFNGQQNKVSREKRENFDAAYQLVKNEWENFLNSGSAYGQESDQIIDNIVVLLTNSYQLGYHDITRSCLDLLPSDYQKINKQTGKKENVKAKLSEMLLNRVGIEILPPVREKTQERVGTVSALRFYDDTREALQTYHDAAQFVRESEVFALMVHTLRTVMADEHLLEEAKKNPASWFEKARALTELSIRIGCDNSVLGELLQALKEFNPNGMQSPLPILTIAYGIAGIDVQRNPTGRSEEGAGLREYNIFSEPLTGANPKQALAFLEMHALVGGQGSVLEQDTAKAYYAIVTSFTGEELHHYGVTAKEVDVAIQRAQKMLINTRERRRMEDVRYELAALEKGKKAA